MHPTIFLLSPANFGGVRAKYLVSPTSTAAAAIAYRNGGVTIEDAFRFMSALYFRGKAEYARRFAVPPEGLATSGIYVIAPGYGLVEPDWIIDEVRYRKLKRTPVDVRRPVYARPLTRAARDLAAGIPAETRVVLLGSVATGKYVDLLWPLFGERFLFPKAFVGMGDMQRGSVMLKACEAGVELEYASPDVPRSRARASRRITDPAAASSSS